MSQQPSFNFGMVPSSSLASAALRNEGIENGQPYGARTQAATGMTTARTASNATGRSAVAAPGINTLGVWLIAVLPALHFAVLYVVFQTLAQPFIPGTQWGLLAAPAIFSLLFAMLDRRSLLARGQESIPGTIWAIIPPLYLIVRCTKVGARSAVTLIVWILLQAAAVVGAFVLLSGVVASAVSAASS
jgi:hypothetical protein